MNGCRAGAQDPGGDRKEKQSEETGREQSLPVYEPF